MGEDRGQKVVAAYEDLGFAFECHLVVFVELLAIDLAAFVQDRLQRFAIAVAEKEGHECFHLLPGVDLQLIQAVAEIMQLVDIGCFAEQGGFVVVGEGGLHGGGVVLKIDDEHPFLAWSGAVQA